MGGQPPAPADGGGAARPEGARPGPAPDSERSEPAETVSLVVVTRNRLPLLRFLLTTLDLQEAPPSRHELVIVDDGSQDGTVRWLRSRPSACAVTVRALACPLGRARARNAGLAAAGGRIVVFLDGDVLAPPTLVAAHRRLHRRAAGPVCVTGHPWFWREVRTWRFEPAAGPLLDEPLLRDWRRFERWAGGPLAGPGAGVRAAHPDAAPFLWCVTRAVSLQRALAVEEGGFCAEFRGYGLEDWEFGYRLWRRGTAFLGDPAAAVWHQAHPPSDRHPGDLLRNYAIFLSRHPDAEVGAMPFCPPWSDMAGYGRLCLGLQHLRRRLPRLAAALTEVAVAAGWAWVRGGGRSPALTDWTAWSLRWGPGRVRQVLLEQNAALGDPALRPALALFQRLVGLAGGA